MLQISTLKAQYIDQVLSQTGLSFRIYTDTGDYHRAIRESNTVTDYINGCFTVSSSDIQYQNQPQEIVGITCDLSFLVRLNDDTDENGEFPSALNFRKALSAAFGSVNPKFNVTENGKTYTVVVSYALPTSGRREILPDIGDSYTYHCTIIFVYLSQALNAADVRITIDGESVPFLSFTITRRPVLSANLYSVNTNGQSTVYSESAAFAIDFRVPAFIGELGNIGAMIADHILGTVSDNTTHEVTVTFGEREPITNSMIFGECSAAGEGLENVGYTVSMIPYATAQEQGG